MPLPATGVQIPTCTLTPHTHQSTTVTRTKATHQRQYTTFRIRTPVGQCMVHRQMGPSALAPSQETTGWTTGLCKIGVVSTGMQLPLVNRTTGTPVLDIVEVLMPHRIGFPVRNTEILRGMPIWTPRWLTCRVMWSVSTCPHRFRMFHRAPQQPKTPPSVQKRAGL